MAQSDESPQAPCEKKKPRWHNGTAPASRVRLSLEKKGVRIKETRIGTSCLLPSEQVSFGISRFDSWSGRTPLIDDDEKIDVEFRD